MKIFDLHIGLSDALLTPRGLFPNQFSFKQARQGKLDIFVGAICPVVFRNHSFVLPDDPVKKVEKHLFIYKKLEGDNRLIIVRNKKDLFKKKLKTILGIEGIYFIKKEKDLARLEVMIDQGIKFIAPMWSFKSYLFKSRRLTKLGKEFLSLCEKKNIVLDLAHSENGLFWTLLNNYSGKIINSHTAYKKIFNHKRNINKKQVEVIVQKNGLVGLSFVGEFLGGNQLDNVYRHISNFLEDFGEDNLSIGSDFCGMEFSDLIKNLEDVSCYQNLFQLLIKKGIQEKTIKKIFYENAYKFVAQTYE